MADIRVKLCGLTSREAVDVSVETGANFLGFVFFKGSPRNVTPKQAAELTASLPNTVLTVAVVVDMKLEEIEQLMEEFQPSYLQLHGSESPVYMQQLKDTFHIPLIKAVKVSCADDIAAAAAYTHVADYLLFDAKPPKTLLPGGNGLVFDWTLLRSRKMAKPWFLSGGLNLQNITDALSISGAKMVDLSSSLESAPGVKDPQLIRQFMKKVKGL